MISKILSNVKSPFTDELIQDLIEKYISCGCDDSLFYNEINKVDDSNESISPSINSLIRKIYSKGIPKVEVYGYEGDDTPLIYDTNSSWMILYSEEDPLKENQRSRNEKNPLIYRIYLNLKNEQKVEFVENYIKKFQEADIPFKLKFSKGESRLDQIVLLSRADNFEENIMAVEELTKDYQLGDLPLLIGSYGNGIGVAEEYYNRLYSPTQVKLALVRSSVKKYLCDYIAEFEDQLLDEEKCKIQEYIDFFKYTEESEKEDFEDFGEKYADLSRTYYQEKSTLDCAKEHIENDHDAYVSGTGLKDIGNVVGRIYSTNPEQFISEVIQNYRMIGTQVWGFAENFVFSNETEKTILESKEKVSLLSGEQIGADLENISRKGIVDKVQADLISMVEEKDKIEETQK